MDIYIVMTNIVKAVRDLENRVDGNKHSAPLRAWLASRGINKQELDKLITSGNINRVSIKSIVLGAPNKEIITTRKNNNRNTKHV